MRLRKYSDDYKRLNRRIKCIMIIVFLAASQARQSRGIQRNEEKVNIM